MEVSDSNDHVEDVGLPLLVHLVVAAHEALGLAPVELHHQRLVQVETGLGQALQLTVHVKSMLVVQKGTHSVPFTRTTPISIVRK